MVRQLKPLNQKNADLINTICEHRTGKNKQFLEKNKALWLNAWNRYEEKKGDPWQLRAARFCAGNEQLFPALYERSSQCAELSYIQELRSEGRTPVCPYCGGKGNASVDHYLPQSIYPEHSLHPRNLIPVCRPCNSNKSNKTKGSQKGVRFIHPYYDNLAGKHVFSLTLVPPFEVVEFNLKVHPTVRAKNERHIVRFHLDELKIEDRALKYFSEEWDIVKKMISGCKRVALARNMVQILKLRSEKEHNCPNGWDILLYDAILSTPKCLHYLAKQ